MKTISQLLKKNNSEQDKNFKLFFTTKKSKINEILKSLNEESYINNLNVIIGGQSESTWGFEGLSFSLKEDLKKHFVLIEQHNRYCLHFENKSNSPFSKSELDRLYKALTFIIPTGTEITSLGGITPGGISGVKKLSNYGFKLIDNIHGKNNYWAGPKLLDDDKLDVWLNKPENKDNFLIINSNEELNKKNTRPIVPVMKKITEISEALIKTHAKDNLPEDELKKKYKIIKKQYIENIGPKIYTNWVKSDDLLSDEVFNEPGGEHHLVISWNVKANPNLDFYKGKGLHFTARFRIDGDTAYEYNWTDQTNDYILKLLMSKKDIEYFKKELIQIYKNH